ncbi:hypothetical protein [Parachryseolinea silvisoli]|jgi:hypothetical protein|uniref:hypothetical protein n=1 Tax=Parachryseolinea silvisoli TaxID=2873601 RepID=UPI002265F7BA|nr:hypothetical protein [Parachryseolinea silvisoli]MCD9020144.1 hypothetical protein [Parachryseolinea silvisoli]
MTLLRKRFYRPVALIAGTLLLVFVCSYGDVFDTQPDDRLAAESVHLIGHASVQANWAYPASVVAKVCEVKGLYNAVCQRWKDASFFRSTQPSRPLQPDGVETFDTAQSCF